MHIVFLTNEYPKNDESHGGIGTFVQNLARNLIKKNSSVSVVGISNNHLDETEIDEGVVIYRLPKSKAKFAKFIFNSNRIKDKLIEINSREPIDVLEGSELSFAFLPKRTSYKKVIRMHGGHHFFSVTLEKKTTFWRSYQEITSFKKADALIAVSNFVGQKTKELLNFKLPFITIYNFIDLEKFSKQKDQSVKKYSILFIGTICKKKGVKELLEAFEIVKKNFPTVVLNLVGRDWSDEVVGSYTEYVKTFISEDNRDAIVFHGVVPNAEIPTMINSAQVCVYPSHSESFGLTLIEAMAIEKPIVASRIPPFEEIMSSDISGLFCDPFSPNDIAEKLIELLTDDAKGLEMGINARKEVLQKFNSENIVQENINFYKSLI
jgi:glycosyltransferase involved in cell wall biosynthesis